MLLKIYVCIRNFIVLSACMHATFPTSIDLIYIYIYIYLPFYLILFSMFLLLPFEGQRLVDRLEMISIVSFCLFYNKCACILDQFSGLCPSKGARIYRIYIRIFFLISTVSQSYIIWFKKRQNYYFFNIPLFDHYFNLSILLN